MLYGLFYICLILFPLFLAFGVVYPLVMFTLYRLTGGKRGLVWYLKHMDF